MGGTLQLIGDWGHVVGAGLFAVLAIWVSRRMSDQRAGKLLVAALSLTAIWLLSIAIGGVYRLETGVMESLRNCGWLVCLFVLPTQLSGANERRTTDILPLYVVLALLLVAQSSLEILASLALSDGSALARINETAIVLRILWAIGALLLIQRIFSISSQATREMVAPAAAAMVMMWAYDLILYGAALFAVDSMVNPLYALRGGLMALLAPVIAVTAFRDRNRVMQPSRALAMRGLGIAAILLLVFGFLIAIMALDAVASPLIRALVTGSVFAMVAGGLLMIPATRFHRHMKVFVSKHLFRHRYDYREQWMAFADTMGRSGGNTDSVHARAVKAMADITESASGALLMAEGESRFSWHSDWNWKCDHPAHLSFDPDLVERMQGRSWVVDIAQARAVDAHGLPEWLAQQDGAWALIPLMHFDELIGAVLLTRPPVMRPLDWEDFDMLRAAGRQVASYIAEARGQHALAEARRFEEFNRRFAFIMHDIKNLVSQIALVARNAERHADNPDFRADMILTLKDCAERMNALLARLSQHNSRSDPAESRFALGDAIQAVVAAKDAGHPLLVEGDLGAEVEADRARVEQIIGHLVQNAIEASEDAAPVIVRARRQGQNVGVAIIDHGCGMTAEFIQDDLFRPFASTKQGGFGIGAYEARELAQALGGDLDVVSVPNRGTTFTFRMPGHGHTATSVATKERAA